MRKLLAFSLLISAAFAVTASADTITAKRIADTKRLLPLKKITVGPDDQYDAAISPDGRYVVYTHKVDLVAHLRIQDLATGELTDLLPVTADSQEPSFSPDGRLVFSYFRYNARGDVCYLKLGSPALSTLKETDVKCLKRSTEVSGTQRSNPFWRSGSEIGYLERAVEGQEAKILSERFSFKEKSGRQVCGRVENFSPTTNGSTRRRQFRSRTL
jgi:hypothetical protein